MTTLIENALDVTPDFYRDRIKEFGDVRSAVWCAEKIEYQFMHIKSMAVCERYLRSGMKVFDAGCGIGDLVECLPSGVEYVGADFCEPFIIHAKKLHPCYEFYMLDLTEKTPFENSEFDFVLMRSYKQLDREESYAEFFRIAPCVLRWTLGDQEDIWSTVELLDSPPRG